MFCSSPRARSSAPVGALRDIRGRWHDPTSDQYLGSSCRVALAAREPRHRSNPVLLPENRALVEAGERARVVGSYAALHARHHRIACRNRRRARGGPRRCARGRHPIYPGAPWRPGGRWRADFPEATMPAFRYSAKNGFVLEFDVKLTQDDVPVVFHDSELDRATDCEGLIAETTLEQLSTCRVDILGTELDFIALEPGDKRAAPIPTLDEVMRYLERTGTHARSRSRTTRAIPTSTRRPSSPRRSWAPSRRATCRDRTSSFKLLAANLIVAGDLLPDAERAFLTLGPTNNGGSVFAKAQGIEWVSPQWPVTPRPCRRRTRFGRASCPTRSTTPGDIVEATRSGSRRHDHQRPDRRAARSRSRPSASGQRSRRPLRPTPVRSTEASTHLGPIVSPLTGAGRPARVRDAVQAGPRKRRDLRQPSGPRSSA